MNSTAVRTTDALGSTPLAALDRRRHRRIQVALLGRFMRESKQEYPCKLTDISVGGAAMMAPVEVDMGERIVAYFDHIGGIEGKVVRTFAGGFAIELIASAHKREKLAAQITWLINRHELGPEADQRRHPRFELKNKTATLKLDEGISVQVNVLDFSMSGASIATQARPPIGAEIVIGKLRARVVRHHAEGIGVEFTELQNPEAVRRHFG